MCGTSECKAGDRMTVATREKCPCCDFDSDGFGKNIIGKGYGSCEIRLIEQLNMTSTFIHIQLELKHF